MQRVQRDDLQVEVRRPAPVDVRVAKPADHVAGLDAPAGLVVVEGGAVEVAVEGVEAGAVGGGVAQDDGGAVVAGGAVVGDRDDSGGKGAVDGGAGRREEVEAQVYGAGLVAVVAGRLEGGGAVDKPRLAVAADSDGRSGGGDLVRDQPIEGAVVGMRQLRAAYGEIQRVGPLQHLGRHDRRVRFRPFRRRHDRSQGGVGAQPARFPDAELGDPPVRGCECVEELPCPLLAHAEVGVVGLQRHLPRLVAHREAGPQRDHWHDRGALGLLKPRHGRVAAHDRACRLEGIGQPHHGVGRCHRHLGRAPVARRVPEVDQPRQARALERWRHHHVVVVRVVVDHAPRQRAANRVEAAKRPLQGGRDQVLSLCQVVETRTNGCLRGLHLPVEVAVELRVLEAVKREVEFRQHRAEGLQNRHRAGTKVGEGDALDEGDGAGDVRGAFEVDPDDSAGGRGGPATSRLQRCHGPVAGVQGRDQARNRRRKPGTLQVLQAGRDEVEDRPPRCRAELENDISFGSRQVEVEVELAGQGGGLALEAEHVARDGGGPGASGGCRVGRGFCARCGHLRLCVLECKEDFTKCNVLHTDYTDMDGSWYPSTGCQVNPGH